MYNQVSRQDDIVIHDTLMGLQELDQVLGTFDSTSGSLSTSLADSITTPGHQPSHSTTTLESRKYQSQFGPPIVSNNITQYVFFHHAI